MPLKDTQITELLKMFKTEPRSAKDIADLVGVHYVTAHKWIKELEKRGIIIEMAFQRGKEKVYCVAVGASTEDGLVRVQFQGGMHLIADFAVHNPQQADPFRYSQSVLAAIYQKSLKKAGVATYAVSYTDVELLDQVRRARALLLDELQLLEQLLEDRYQRERTTKGSQS
jgi:DNA-binding Lrp family transcriptional regulator